MNRADEEIENNGMMREIGGMFFYTNSFFQSNLPRQEVISSATRIL